MADEIPTEIPTRDVLGMRVPLPMVPRIVASMRGTYPDLTSGLDDEAVVRVVVKHWVTSTLVVFESRTAEAPAVEAVLEAEAERDRRAQRAREKALKDASAIREIPPPVTPSPPVDSVSPVDLLTGPDAVTQSVGRVNKE